MPRNNLFGVPVNELKWGIAPGEHVCHIFVDGTPNTVEVPYDGTEPDVSGYNGVEQKEMYNTPADKATARLFMELASEAEKDYTSDLCEGDFGNGYIEILESLKGYLLANSRHGQQEALEKFRKDVEKFRKDLESEVQRTDYLDVDEQEEVERCQMRLDRLKKYTDILNQKTMGSLEVPPENARKKNAKKPEEPYNTYIGKAAVWVSTNQELFPHEPSPNDIKQGYGVEDCFMLSAVAVKAAKDPQFIKDMMKDNGDGTVTVRLYDGKKKPVYIDVQKTVNKSIFNNNVYSAGSLWVQMLEKAYAQYATMVNEKKINGWSSGSPNKKAKGFKAIDRGSSMHFMNAFDPEYTYTGGGMTPTSFTDLNYLYDFDSNGKRTYPIDREKYGYLTYEEELFKCFDKHINKEKEVITVGSSTTGLVGALDSDQVNFLKTHGMRTGHAYGILKVFEKEVNGKTKKFVQLRDPYATFKAQYNDKGQLEANGSGLTPGGATMLGGIKNAGYDEMGTFNLEFTDFLTYFKTFSAIKEETLKDMDTVVQKYHYFTDEQGKKHYGPLYNHVKDFKEEAVEKAIPYTKEEEEIALQDLSDEEKKVYERLTNEPKKLYNGLKGLKNELKCTDEFFTWPNSGTFNKMRDSCYKLTKSLANYRVVGVSLAEKIKMVKGFTELGKLANDYQTKKTNDLKEMQQDGKSPSVRFVHRLTAAMNIRNLCDGEELLKTWPDKNAEGMGIMMNDISTKIERVHNGEIKIKNENEITRMEEVVSIIDKEIKKHPELVKAAKVEPSKVEEAQNDLGEFELLKNEPDSGNKKEEEEKAEYDPAADYEQMEFEGMEFMGF